MVYILIFRNGESYEDQEFWNAGIFSSKNDAKEYGIKNTIHCFEIEEWEFNKQKCNHSWIFDYLLNQWMESINS